MQQLRKLGRALRLLLVCWLKQESKRHTVKKLKMPNLLWFCVEEIQKFERMECQGVLIIWNPLTHIMRRKKMKTYFFIILSFSPTFHLVKAHSNLKGHPQCYVLHKKNSSLSRTNFSCIYSPLLFLYTLMYTNATYIL